MSRSATAKVFRRLAGAMGYTEADLFDDDMTAIRDSMPDVDVDELRRVGWLRVPYPDDGRPFGDGVFPWPVEGRIRQCSIDVAMGQPALPATVPPLEGPGSRLAERYPLQLMPRNTHNRFLNTGYSRLPGHGGRESGPFLGTMCRRPGHSRHRRRSVRAGVQRSSFHRGPGPYHRTNATRCGVDPMGLVEPSSPRRHGRQLADQRHADRMGRRRGVLRHPRRGQRSVTWAGLIGQSIPSEQARGGSLATWQAS